jgi:hypothetical protein
MKIYYLLFISVIMFFGDHFKIEAFLYPKKFTQSQIQNIY